MKDIKQVIVIRRDLRMRRGKEIAQGAHASIAWLTDRLNLNPPLEEDAIWAEARFTEVEWRWIYSNHRKICVVVNSEEELLEIVQLAEEAGLVAEPIQDAGLTEFGGVPTWTAVAIGPDYDEKIDPITGHLVLY